MEPNWLFKTVSTELQKGQDRTFFFSFKKGKRFSLSVLSGGAMPYVLSFALVSSVIQSVVQAGEKMVFILMFW